MKFGGCEKGDSERPGDSDAKRLGVDDIEGFVGANLRRASEEEPTLAEWGVVEVDVPMSSVRSAEVF